MSISKFSSIRTHAYRKTRSASARVVALGIRLPHHEPSGSKKRLEHELEFVNSSNSHGMKNDSSIGHCITMGIERFLNHRVMKGPARATAYISMRIDICKHSGDILTHGNYWCGLSDPDWPRNATKNQWSSSNVKCAPCVGIHTEPSVGLILSRWWERRSAAIQGTWSIGHILWVMSFGDLRACTSAYRSVQNLLNSWPNGGWPLRLWRWDVYRKLRLNI